MASARRQPAAEPAAPAIAAPAVKTAAKGGRTCIVACKLPSGLVLQLCKPSKYFEETRAGGRIERTRYDKMGPSIIVRGPAQPNGQVPKGYKRPEVEGGYALTYNVDADFFEEWMRQNADTAIVQNKIIFAAGTRDATLGEAQDMHETRSGLEALEPDNDPRAPKSLDPNVSTIETEEGRKGRIPAGA